MARTVTTTPIPGGQTVTTATRSYQASNVFSKTTQDVQTPDQQAMLDIQSHTVANPGNTADQSFLNYDIHQQAAGIDYGQSANVASFTTFNENHYQSVSLFSQTATTDGEVTYSSAGQSITTSSNGGMNVVFHDSETNLVTHINTYDGMI